MADMMDNPQQNPTLLQQQPQPQQQPPQGASPELNQDNWLPANDKEADAIEEAILHLLYDEKLTFQFMDMIGNSPTVEEGVAKVASTVIFRAINELVSKSGRDVDPDFIAELIDVVIKELFRMMYTAGMIKQEPPLEVLQDIMDLTMQLIEQNIAAGSEEQQLQAQAAQQQQQQPPQQQQMQQQPPQQSLLG